MSLSMPIEPTAASEATAAPSENTAAQTGDHKHILRDKNDAVDTVPSATDAMGIQARADLPGATHVELAQPAIAQKELNTAQPATGKHIPASHTTQPQSSKFRLPGMGKTKSREPVPPAAASADAASSPPSFKEKVLGFAKIHRGNITGKKDVKEEGKKILSGEIKPDEVKK